MPKYNPEVSNIPSVSSSAAAKYLLSGFLILQLFMAVVVVTIVLQAPPSTNQAAALNAPNQQEAALPKVEPAPLNPSFQVIDTARDTLAQPNQENNQSLPNMVTSQPSAVVNIGGAEVTQGIQVFNLPEHHRCHPDPGHPQYIFCNNSMPLIAGRHTMVRVFLSCNTDCPSQPTQLKLRLSKDNQAELVLEQTILPEQIAAVNGVQFHQVRKNLDQTINFNLFPPPEWLVGVVNIQLEATTGEQWASHQFTGQFIQRKPLRIAYLPIRHNGVTPGAIENVDYWLERMFPVPNVEYYRLPMPDLVWDKELNRDELLRELHHVYQLYTQHNPPENWPDQLFGWLPQEFYNGGISDPYWCSDCAGLQSSRVAFGGLRTEQDIGGPRILVHEIAHNLGARHAWTPTNDQDPYCFKKAGVDIQVDPSWPYPEMPYIQEFGIDLYSDPPIIYSPSYYDVMAYCAAPWISPHTYRTLVNSPILTKDSPNAILHAAFQPKLPQTSPGVLLINGVIYPDGTVARPEITFLDTIPVNKQGFVPPAGETYCLDIQNSQNQTLVKRCFEAGFDDLESPLPSSSSPFYLALPGLSPDQIGQILITRHNQLLMQLLPSDNHPYVKLTSPNGGEQWQGQQQITWEATDADGDSLQYDLLYSPDNGQSWLPVAVRLTENQYNLDTTVLPGSDKGLIKVVASDGFFSHSDQSDGLFGLN